MVKFFKRIWRTIDRAFRTYKVWENMAPVDGEEPKLSLNDRIQLKIILSWLDSCREKERAEKVTNDDDEILREGLKLYSLNDRVESELRKRGYTIHTGPRQLQKAQDFELI